MLAFFGRIKIDLARYSHHGPATPRVRARFTCMNLDWKFDDDWIENMTWASSDPETLTNKQWQVRRCETPLSIYSIRVAIRLQCFYPARSKRQLRDLFTSVSVWYINWRARHDLFSRDSTDDPWWPLFQVTMWCRCTFRSATTASSAIRPRRTSAAGSAPPKYDCLWLACPFCTCTYITALLLSESRVNISSLNVSQFCALNDSNSKLYEQ